MTVTDLRGRVSALHGMTDRVPRVPARLRTPLGLVVALLVVQLIFRTPIELIGPGAALGATYGLTAVAILLIYRNNKIVNFAAAALGAPGGVLAAILTTSHGVPFFVAFPLALVTGAGLGALSDYLVVRRFANAPRLTLTVVTLGLAQTLALLTIFVPIWFGTEGAPPVVPTPFDGFKIMRGTKIVLVGSQIFAIAVVVALVAALAFALKRSRLGIGLRAAAENPDRAAILGIPVRLIGTLAWSVAGTFAGATIFLRSTLVGIPLDGSLGYTVLLFVLAAAVVARLEHVDRALAAGIVIGVLERGSYVRTGSSELTSAIMLVVILGSLLLQRGAVSRAVDSVTSGLGVAGQVRPVPPELARLPEVRVGRVVLLAGVAVLAVLAPSIVGTGQLRSLTLLPIFGIVAVSLVVLAGWAGQISLGQMGLVGVGAAVAAGLAADHNVDFFVALVVGVLAGAAVAALIGLPAVRLPGLYLAVVTLSFAGAVQFWLLKKGKPIADLLLPSGLNPRIRRPSLYHRIDLANDRTFYLFAVVMLVLAILLARTFRASRSGRILLAVRDNSRAAPAYAVDVVRTRLVAFALSGGIAAAAGVLYVYQQQTFDANTYGVDQSVLVFVAAVIGGLASLPGAVAGALLVFAVRYFAGAKWSQALTGPGLVLVLMLLPGGLSQVMQSVRDLGLRRIADRRGIVVPSLTAQRRTPDAPDGELLDGDEPPLVAAGDHLAHEPELTEVGS